MNNKIWNHAVSEIIDEREHKTSVNKEFDLLYETFIKSIFYEIDAHLIIDDDSKSRIKKRRNLKPYWNKQLDRVWKNVTQAENNSENLMGIEILN